MASFDYPDNAPMVGADMKATTPWLQLFSRWQGIILSVQESGTTAQRPVKGLFIGRQYFDTNIGKPLFIKSVTAGVAVWVDAAGVVVP